MYFNAVHRSSLKTKLNTVELLNVPTAEVGGKLQLGNFDVKVHDGASYTATGFWVDAKTGIPVQTENVENGKGYRLIIDITANAGYEFADEVIVKTDGASHKLFGGYEYLTLTRDYDFNKTVEKVEVTGITEPAVGATPTTDGLKVADADKYEIITAEWTDINSPNNEPIAKFEDGHSYALNVAVAAKEGYRFAPETVLSFNGEEYYMGHYSDVANLSAEFSFKKVIEEVRIENAPVMKVGESTPEGDIITDIKVPDGAKYNAVAHWLVYNETAEMFETFSGVFEKGKTYTLSISVNTESGYTIDPEQTSFYVNGNKVSDNNIVINLDDSASIYLEFTEGAKVIEKLEITVEKPVIGDHSSMNPIVTLPKDANYSLFKTNIPFWLIGNEKNRYPFEGYFNEDDNYGTSFTVVANEGYIFAEDLIVIVNGTVLSKEDVFTGLKQANINYFFNAKCQHIYTDANDDTCDACGAKRDIPKSPKTGDNTVVLLFTAIIFSGAIMIISKLKKAKIQ